MEIGVFNEFTKGTKPVVSSSSVNVTQPIQAAQSVQVSPANTQKDNKKQKVVETLKVATPIAISLASLAVSGVVIHKSGKNVSALTEQVAELKEQIAKIATDNAEKVTTAAKKENTQIWTALLGLAGVGTGYVAGQMTDVEKEDAANRIKTRISGISDRAESAQGSANLALAASNNSLNTKYVENVNGIQLLKNIAPSDLGKYNAAIEQIQTVAKKYLYEEPTVTPITKENPTLWSVTSEFAPIKEGGLGSVPVEVQNNAEKLGVNMPTFIPMYQNSGSFRQVGDKFIYEYNKNSFELEKAAEFTVDAFQNGKSTEQKVEFYLGKTKAGHQLIFVKNDKYFNGTIYQTGTKSEEPEKFAFFSKAVYELAKAKIDMNSVKGLKIENPEVFDSIKAPDALVLNDWQASPIAALARYKAPMENAYGRLSNEAAKQLSEMNIITIGHNAMYQGSTQNNNNDNQRKEATSNILNTLFDNYTADIVKNAESGATEKFPDDEGLKNLDNVLLLNKDDASQNHTNLLNMGIILSNYFHPVSQNYAKELVSPDHKDLSYELAWALTQKDEAGSLYGIINGNDFNNLSIEAKKGNIKSTTGLDFETYNKQSDISDVMSARLNNKINFYNNFMVPFCLKNDETNNSEDVNKVRDLTSRLECYGKDGSVTKLPQITDDVLAETPIISSVGRLVSQKGIPVMTEAINMLLTNWEKDFPGKKKPIFYIAGGDGENGAQRKHIEKLKDDKLSKEDANRVVFAHGFAPMAAITAASDFFLLPSMFEPCGLTQGESFAVATPVIGSAVGGIVDTVNRDGKENGILTEKAKKLEAKAFYNAMKKGLDIYFNNPEQYQKMVNDSLAEDFSWIQPGKQGPVYEYLEKIGIDRNSLKDPA